MPSYILTASLLALGVYLHHAAAAAIPAADEQPALYPVVYATPWTTIARTIDPPAPTDGQDYSTVTVRTTHTIFSNPPASLQTTAPALAERQDSDPAAADSSASFSYLEALWTDFASLSAPPPYSAPLAAVDVAAAGNAGDDEVVVKTFTTSVSAPSVVAAHHPFTGVPGADDCVTVTDVTYTTSTVVVSPSSGPAVVTVVKG